MNRITRLAAFFIIAALFSIQSWAKENAAGPEVIVLNKGSLWSQFPWIWVIAGGIFILSLIAMLRTSIKKA